MQVGNALGYVTVTANKKQIVMTPITDITITSNSPIVKPPGTLELTFNIPAGPPVVPAPENVYFNINFGDGTANVVKFTNNFPRGDEYKLTYTFDDAVPAKVQTRINASNLVSSKLFVINSTVQVEISGPSLVSLGKISS